MMLFRPFALPILSVLVTAHAVAQTDSKPSSKPTDDRALEVTGLPQNEQDKVKELQEELARAKRELEHLHKIQSKGGIVSLVKRKFGLRQYEARAFTPEASATAAKVPARTLNETERKSLPTNTMFTVDHHAVTAPEFRRVYTFLKRARPELGPDDFRRESILTTALRAATLGSDPQSAARARRQLEAARNQITEERVPFDDVCSQISQGPNAKSGGLLENLTANSRDALFMSRVWELEPGDTAIVESTEGYHYVECAEVKPKQRTVRQIFLPYTSDVASIHDRVKAGAVQFAFADPNDVKFAPGEKGGGKGKGKGKGKRANKKRANQKKGNVPHGLKRVDKLPPGVKKQPN